MPDRQAARQTYTDAQRKGNLRWKSRDIEKERGREREREREREKPKIERG